MVGRNFVLGAVLSLLALGYLIATIQIPTGVATSTEVGPRTFPYLVGGALLVVSAGFLLAQALRGRSARVSSGEATSAQKVDQEGNEQPEEATASEQVSTGTDTNAGSGEVSQRDWSRYTHVVMFAAVAVYVLLLSFVGFLIPTAIYIAAGTLIVSTPGSYRGARLAVPAAYGVAGSVALYLLFDGALSVTLPRGILGI